ncbi:methyltransferase [Paraglaciecola marina]|uniref:methyltransferase n=1 Tax=Paraglaciecola marina TaxID=2500157 RepID=UPI0010616899|nr:methyltransferase [Paraglaciecola marina]
MNTCLTLLNKNLHLVRYPESLQHPSWQAWDSADEYLIEHVEQHIDLEKTENIRIINDDFGALACWFANSNPIWVSDSYVAKQACVLNLAKNELDVSQITFTDSVKQISSTVDLVLLKIPKTNALLEQQLIDLQPSVTASTKIIAAGKANLIPKSMLGLFEKYLGPTTTSLAKKKSRLVFCQPTADKSHTSPYPTTWYTDSPKFKINNLANVFARQQLDIGARFILEHFKKLPSFDNKTIVDLGCGNGVLGLHILNSSSPDKVIFVDESYMAVASAKHNIETNLPDKLHLCEFRIDNCLENFRQTIEHAQVDLVLCNPPFHQQNTITDHIAWQMFTDAKGVLRKGGQLCVVGNRHLDYPKKLKRLFGNTNAVATGKKFSILAATK